MGPDVVAVIAADAAVAVAAVAVAVVLVQLPLTWPWWKCGHRTFCAVPANQMYNSGSDSSS